jgi:hypothetical protein
MSIRLRLLRGEEGALRDMRLIGGPKPGILVCKRHRL